jgi:hypothetical protein
MQANPLQEDLVKPGIIACVSAVVLTAGSIVAQSGGRTAEPSEASLLAAREAVWRDFFANAPTLEAVLPANFVALYAGDSTWQDKAAVLAASRGSATGGTKLVSLRFPRNKIERVGPVALIYSRYEMELEGPDGRTTRRGNVTEVFRWDGKRWLHPSWHIDNDG